MVPLISLANTETQLICSTFFDVITLIDCYYNSRGQVLHRFVELLEELRLFGFKKSQDYPELKDLNWLNDLMFSTDFTTMHNGAAIFLHEFY